MVAGLRVELSYSAYETDEITLPPTRKGGGAGGESNPSYSVRRYKET
jgi:hypothetical protein